MTKFPGESAAYRAARDELLTAEAALRDQTEAVAAMRRALPLGGQVEQDYVFMEGPADLAEDDPVTEVKLSELFEGGKGELIVINLMFAKDAEQSCPMCSAWADSYNGAAPHVRQKVNLVLVARKDIRGLRAWARARGWNHLRLLSCSESSFNLDYRMEGKDGSQMPGVTVFRKTEDGIHHHWSTELFSAGPGGEGQDPRGIDILSVVYNLLDLTPSGRERFYPALSYDDWKPNYESPANVGS